MTVATGTATPNAVIHVTGSTLQNVTVEPDGNFLIGFLPPLFFGVQSLTLTQEVNGEISAPLVIDFTVIPQPPTLTSPAPASTVPISASPLTLSGMGVGGATIRVEVDGIMQSSTPQSDQGWAVTLDGPLEIGPHALVITQEISGAFSDPLVTSLVVSAAPAQPTVPPAPPITPAEPANPPNSPALPATGAVSQPVAILALLFILGGSVLRSKVASRRSDARWASSGR